MENKIEVGIERKCGNCLHFEEHGKNGNGICTADCILGGDITSAFHRCFLRGHFKTRPSVYKHLESVHRCKISDLKIVFI